MISAAILSAVILATVILFAVILAIVILATVILATVILSTPLFRSTHSLTRGYQEKLNRLPLHIPIAMSRVIIPRSPRSAGGRPGGDGPGRDMSGEVRPGGDKPDGDMPDGAWPGRDELLLQGTIIYGDDLQLLEGYISIRDGMIKEVDTGRVDADFEGIICPRFVNSHLHLGDSAFKDPPFQPLSQLVGPGGLKMHLLGSTPRDHLIEGMRRSLLQMMASGTCAFADFREGGEEGIRMLEEARRGIPLLMRIFGRPLPGDTVTPDGCYGLGMSSTRDHDPGAVQRMVGEARRAGKAVAIHAGEASRDDIQDALSLLPDHLVHMSRAEESDLKSVARAGIPLVICPRSNLITGSGVPNVKKMMELGIVLGVGTDNVMLNSPNMFAEMHLISRALLHDDRQVFKMCTLNGAEIMGLDQKLGSIREGKEAKVMVINGSSDNLWGSTHPLRSIVRRAEPTDILAIF